MSQQIARLTVPPGQTGVELTVSPDVAFLEGKGAVKVRLEVWNGNDVHRVSLGAVEYEFMVRGGVLCWSDGRKRTTRDGSPTTQFRTRFHTSLDHADLVERGTAFDFTLGKQLYQQYELMPEVWVDAEHSRDALYRLDMVTFARPMRAGVVGLERK